MDAPAIDRTKLDAFAMRAVGDLSARERAALGLPWSPQLIERARRSVGATIQAAEAALTDGVGVNLGGGTHHAAHAAGRGFCVFNDVVCATRTLRAAGAVRRVLRCCGGCCTCICCACTDACAAAPMTLSRAQAAQPWPAKCWCSGCAVHTTSLPPLRCA